MKDLQLTHEQACPAHPFPVAPVPAGCGLCSGPVSPLDGAAAFGQHRGSARPRPCGRTGGAASAGLSPWPLPSVSAGWDRAEGHNLPEALRQLPEERHRCASPGHGGTEGMRNPSPAIPGLSVLGRARPGSARGSDAGRARRKAEERGRIPGLPPCLAANPAPSVRTGPAGGAEMSPRSSVRSPARLPGPDSSPGREGCGCQRQDGGYTQNLSSHLQFGLPARPVASHTLGWPLSSRPCSLPEPSLPCGGTFLP